MMKLLYRLFDMGCPYLQAAFWLSVTWLAAVFLSVVLWSEGFLGVVLAIPVFASLAVAGLLVIGLGWSRAWVLRHQRRAALTAAISPMIVVAAGVGMILPIIWLVASVMTWAHFLVNKHVYVEIVRRAEEGQLAPQSEEWMGQVLGENFLLDKGRPVRVAFPEPGGFLDNWNGVVYDPTGRVMTARGFTDTGGFTASPEVQKLFYGDIVSCWHLSGSFYSCTFT